jgi:hypothetical protein
MKTEKNDGGKSTQPCAQKSERALERGAIIENAALNSAKAQHQVGFQKVDLPKKAGTRPEKKT